VTPLHTLVLPRRHTPTSFDLYEPERRPINLLLDQVHFDILAEDKTVEGFNIGMNSGEVAGQSVMHCHVHLIPRRQGNVAGLTGRSRPRSGSYMLGDKHGSGR
jgi:diadenosine tetraphosphate (Ap4A) HIT family hydrolase